MTKKNKLYTVNKWNRPAFMPDRNLFPDGGNIAAWDRLASQHYGASYGDAGSTMEDYMKSTNAFGLSKADNPFSKGNLAGGLKGVASTGIGAGLISGLGSAVGSAGYNLISGGLSSGAGKTISSIGSTVGGMVGKVNPVLGAAIGAASGIIGGGVNALFGTAVNQEKLNAAKEGTTALNNFTSNASSLDDINGPQAQLNVQDAYKSGLLNKGWAKKRNAEVRDARQDATSLAYRGIENNADNLMADTLNNELANYSAFGGPIDFNDRNMGALGYGLMSDYLTMKNRQIDTKNKMTGITPISTFAFGGDMQTNANDYSLGGVYDVTEQEANRLKSLGYGFTVVS